MSDEKSLEDLLNELLDKLQDSEFLVNIKKNLPENNKEVTSVEPPTVTAFKEQQRKLNESLDAVRKHRRQTAKLNKDLRKLKELYKKFKK